MSTNGQKKISDESLDRAMLSALSSLANLTKELSKRMTTKQKINLFQEKKDFLRDQGIENLSIQELEPIIYELCELNKDLIAMAQPKHLKQFIERRHNEVTESVEEQHERRANRTKAQVEREIMKARKSNRSKEKLSPYLKLMKTVNETLGVPLTELHDKDEKALKKMLADFMMK